MTKLETCSQMITDCSWRNQKGIIHTPLLFHKKRLGILIHARCHIFTWAGPVSQKGSSTKLRRQRSIDNQMLRQTWGGKKKRKEQNSKIRDRQRRRRNRRGISGFALGGKLLYFLEFLQCCLKIPCKLRIFNFLTRLNNFPDYQGKIKC